MNKYILLIFCSMSCTLLFSQNWQALGNFNRAVNSLYGDTSSHLLYVGGSFKWSDLDTMNGICSWDGLHLAELKDGLYDACGVNVCHAKPLIVGYRNELYVGSAFKEIDGQYSNGIAKWDGQDWLPLGGSLQSEDGYAAAWGGCVFDDKLFVVGSFRFAGGDTCNSVAYWDGIQWTGLAFPPNVLLGEIPLNYRCVFYKNELYVGGNFHHNLNGEINHSIAKLEDATWKKVGAGLSGGDSEILEMIVYKNELYVCGSFRSEVGNAGNKIMRWDGVQWRDVGGGLCNSDDIAVDMMVYDGKLYVVGAFSCVGDGLAANNIATWDGERWCTVGNSVFNNKISSIEAYNGEIYIGGGFTEVDNQPCRYFAKWVGDHSTDTCSAPVSAVQELEQAHPELQLWPNPAGEILHLQVAGAVEAAQVLDATGKLVLNFPSNIRSAPGAAVSLPIAAMPAGLYWVSVQSEGRTLSGRFVKME